MKLHLEKSVLIGFLITVVVLAALGIFSFSSTQRLINTANLLSHGGRIISNAEMVVKAIIDIETGQRGFVITGDEEFLEPYYEATRNLDRYLNTLDSLTEKNPVQQARVAELRSAIRQKLKWSKNVIDVRKSSFEEAQLLIAGREGKKTTDRIRTIVKDIQKEEREIFRKGNTISRASLKQFQYSFIGLAVTITLIIAFLFYAINKTLKKRNQIEAKLKKTAGESRDLYDHAPCGYFSVDKDIVISDVNQTLLQWMGYSYEDLIGKKKFTELLSDDSRTSFLSTFEVNFEQYKKDGYVNDLEFVFQRKDGSTFPVIVSSLLLFDDEKEFAGSRTTVSDNTERKKSDNRIKLLNQELEAFTYSVSHDLRAPLRSIMGYAQILREDFGKILDEEGNRVLQVITSNAKRMGQLIDDLLDFSRLGKKELSRTLINMDEMVADIVRDQRVHENGRQLNIQIQTLKSAKGDSSMIRQVWINLISNALKYSRNRSVAQIDIGSIEENTETHYYIRDNGTGFDMQYVEKLFGVFQRLHKMDEFEGTGVGLALVKTIVKRHGGRVWAEGKLNEGATFYFSLPAD